MDDPNDHDVHNHGIQAENTMHSPLFSAATSHSGADTPSSPAQASPLSPRVLAVQALKRAASLREGNGGGSPTQGSPRAGMKLGLERSASDAARRVAMAKLTGEKLSAPPEYMVPKTPLPTGPLPSLADLQARAEQRLGLSSPEPLPAQGSFNLSRNPSLGSSALSRSPSAASSALSRNASLAGRSMGAMSPSGSAGDNSIEDGDEEEGKQKKTEERQEARTNLIRKLSSRRLAPGAAAAARERAGMASPTQEPLPNPANPGLQRRPSLADVLARAESRAEAGQQVIDTTSGTMTLQGSPGTAHYTSPSSAGRTPATASASTAGTPSRFNMMSPASAMSSSASSKGLYDHIPVPPMPDTPESSTSARGPQRALASHESMYSAVSNFRPYRHTVERDRDSAFARYQMEDNFEFELGTEGGMHERHPLSEEEEDLRDDQAYATSPRRQPNNPADTMFSPPDSPLDAKMILPRAQASSLLQAASDISQARPTSLSPIQRSADSMPETPEMVSPISPFSFTPAAFEQAASPRNVATTADPPTLPTPFSFMQHRQRDANMSTDSFPVSVAASHTSRHPQSLTFSHDSLPPLPTELPISASQSKYDLSSPSLPAGSMPLAAPLVLKGSPKASVKPMDAAESARSRIPTGPIAEYRFPGTRLEGSRPTSLASNEGLDKTMDRMIDHLEALQASDKPAKQEKQPKGLALALELFAAQAQEDNKKLSSTPMQAQTSASALHEFHASHQPAHPVPHELPTASSQPVPRLQPTPLLQRVQPANPIQPSSTLPIPPATSADYAKYSNSKLAPFPGIVELERQRSAPGPAIPSQTSAKTAQIGRAPHQAVPPAVHQQRAPPEAQSGETLTFPNHKRYNSDGSGQNDSAPSLARTGSSSSGGSNKSDTLPPLPKPQSNVTKDQVMQRLSDLLSSYSEPKKPSGLDLPPRQLLLHAPVLQVVNANTVKDRYLFLFTDILVIAKPLVEEDVNGQPISPTLQTKYLVKSIVELPKLKLTAQAADSADDPVQKRKHPLLLTFVDRFANDPKKAISALIAKAGLSNDAATIANLLFRNPELNRSQLGAYLAMKEHKPVLKAYCDRFRLGGVRIEDALRVFIASLRLPNDYAAAEYLLGVFASQWLANNPGTGMTNDNVFATKFVVSMMELNDALHSGIDDETAAAGNLFSFPNHAITVDDFIAASRAKDPHGTLPDEHLTRIYLSIRRDRVQQAADNSIASVTPEIEIITHPGKLPSRLTYRTPSENISITLPRLDPKLSIRLVGQDMRFEPPLLTFSRSRTATFRITPTALGSKSMLFVKLGATSGLYRNLPVNKTFSVERAFMNHTFQIAFVNHLGVKRKYLFSMSSAEAKFTWVDTLRQRIENSPVEQGSTPRATKVADAVSLQVLRDALIAPDEPAPVLASKPGALAGRPGFMTPPGSRGGLRSAAGGLQRSNSFSKTYPHGLGKAEGDLNVEQRRPSGPIFGNNSAPVGARRGSREETTQSKTGNEIVTMVQQNSLLPLVLGFASAGAGVDAMPRRAVFPNPLPAQATPPQQGRGTGRFRNL